MLSPDIVQRMSLSRWPSRPLRAAVLGRARDRIVPDPSRASALSRRRRPDAAPRDAHGARSRRRIVFPGAAASDCSPRSGACAASTATPRSFPISRTRWGRCDFVPPRVTRSRLGLAAREKIRYDMPYDENDLSGWVRISRSAPPGRRDPRAAAPAPRGLRGSLRALARGGAERARLRRDASPAREAEGALNSAARPGGAALEWGLAGEYEDLWLSLEGIRGSFGESGYQETVQHLARGSARGAAPRGMSRYAPAGSRATVTAGVNVSRDFYSWGIARESAPLPGTPGFAFVSPRLSVLARLGEASRAWASVGAHAAGRRSSTGSSGRAFPSGGTERRSNRRRGSRRGQRLTLRTEGYSGANGAPGFRSKT